MHQFRAAVFLSGTTAGMAIGAFHHRGAPTLRRLGGWNDIVVLTQHSLRLRSEDGAREAFDIEIPCSSIKRVWHEQALFSNKLWIDAGNRYALRFRGAQRVEEVVAAFRALGVPVEGAR